MFDQLRTIGRWHQVWLKEAVRVLRSGGVAKVFSGVRTFHRLAQAMEMAGLEIIRIEAWTYGSGWPKSLDVARALDHTLGVEREEKTPPVTEIAQRYDDYGTALKSCWEPFLVGRKR
jgi:site-specific DNA-methyltransferase (adenine-specific)